MHDGGERGSEGLEHVDQDTLAMTETGKHMKWGEEGRSRMLIDGGHREGEECGEHKEPRTRTQENGMRLNFEMSKLILHQKYILCNYSNL